jgi:hypothetical protein
MSALHAVARPSEGTWTDWWLAFLLLVTNVSQLPGIVSNSTIRMLVPLAWAVFLVFLLLSGMATRVPSELRAVGWLLLVWDAYVITLSLVSGRAYFASSLMYSLHIALFQFVAGFLAGMRGSKQTFSRACIGFVSGAFVLALVLYLARLRGMA